MTHDHDLTPEEQAELAALPRERTPGRLLEARTVQALRARGLLPERPRRLSWVAAGVAAAAGRVAGGAVVGTEGAGRRRATWW